MKADALRGHLDAMILAVLEKEPLHGYAIIEALSLRSGGELDLPTGTVYPALRRLEAAGHLRSTWATAGGRKRRTYTLSRAGGGRWPSSARSGGRSRRSSTACSARRDGDLRGIPDADPGRGRDTGAREHRRGLRRSTGPALVGPRRVRRGLVQEARDHLDDASDALSDAGYDRAEAERIAVADFGYARRDRAGVPDHAGRGRVAAYGVDAVRGAGDPAVPVGRAPGSGRRLRPRTASLFAILDHAVEWGGGAMIVAAVALLVATGVGNRWFAAGRGIARLTAITSSCAPSRSRSSRSAWCC